MDEIKEEMKKIMLMGLGAMSMTSEKAAALKEDLTEKGEALLKQGKIANEELKHKIHEKMQDNSSVTIVKKEIEKEDVLKFAEKLTEKEKEELIKELSKEKKEKKEVKNEK